MRLCNIETETATWFDIPEAKEAMPWNLQVNSSLSLQPEVQVLLYVLFLFGFYLKKAEV